MNQYIAIHNHEYGFSTYCFESERDIYSESPEEIAEKLGIEFQPCNGEDITIILLDLASCPVI
jgi:hypothetical protein